MAVYLKMESHMSESVGELSRARTFNLLSLRRRWKLIALCGALSVLAGLLFLLFKPVKYTASTQLLVYVREIQLGPEPVVSPGRADLTQVQNEIEIIRSRGVLAAVVRSLGLDTDDEFVSAPSRLGSMVEWLYRPRRSGEEASTNLDLAIGALQKRLVVKKVGTSHTIQVNVATSDPHKSERIANAIGQAAVERRFGADPSGSKSPLRRERLQGLGPNAYVMTAAGVPSRPDGPRKIIVLAAALGFGLVLGTALALLLDFRNSTVRTAAQVEHLGLECFGPIPFLCRRNAAAASGVVGGRKLAVKDRFLPNPMQDQTLRRAAVAIQNTGARKIGVTSAVTGEGAATVAAQLARTCRGSKVLLVEASLKEPSGDGDEFGLTNALSVPRGIVLDSSGGFDVLEVGGLNSGEASGASWMQHGPSVLGNYDLIVVCLPPLEQGPEFRMAARNLDGILLVIKWGETTIETIERAIAVSSVSDSDFVGAVLNMVDERMIGAFGDKFWNAEAALAARRRSFAFEA
ncbi:MAG: Wzz/FepE/Etk N-terminal domain-containing protein [Pseudolabrys sp.]